MFGVFIGVIAHAGLPLSALDGLVAVPSLSHHHFMEVVLTDIMCLRFLGVGTVPFMIVLCVFVARLTSLLLK